MLRYACICVVSVMLLCGSSAFGQFFGMSGPDNTLTVSVTGIADCDADWAEVGFTISSHGPTAADALLSSQDQVQKATAQLEKAGFRKADARVGPPHIGASAGSYSYGPPGPPGAPGEDAAAEMDRFGVAVELTIRINHPAAGTLYDSVCRAMDAVIVPGKSGARMLSDAEMMSSREMVIFGVDDPKPLRDKAIADALDRAAELAGVVAQKAGKKLGPLVNVGAQGTDEDRYMMMPPMPYGMGKPGRSTYRASLSATYRLQ